MLLMASVAPPELVSDIAWESLVVPIFCVPKFKELVPGVAIGITPVPFRLTDVTLTEFWLDALLTMLPLRAPVAIGVKVTLMVQVAPAAKVFRHVVVRA